MSSLATRLLAMPEAERRAALADLSSDELVALEHAWRVWARPEQLLPAEPFDIAMYMAGRGWGKTRTGAEAVRGEVESGRRCRVVVLSPTAATMRRDVVEGSSGLLAIAPPNFRPTYEPSTLKVTYPNGARVDLVSSETPDRLRGGNWDFAWIDEFAACTSPQECLDMLIFANRLAGPLGHAPQIVITTTPRPIPALKKLLKMPGVIVIRGHTDENRANLSESAVALMKERYEGTRLGRQELAGELLTDTPGALWTRDLLDDTRVTHAPHMKRIVVGIDPAGSSNRGGAETGIVAVGRGEDDHVYVLADRSGQYTPAQWARRAVDLCIDLKADRIVAERNYGGDMVEATIRMIAPRAPIRMVTATRGKAVRAEPIVALYEKKTAHHVGCFSELEDQLCEWNPMEPGPSPDRLDAMVWGLTEIYDGQRPAIITRLGY